jgi:branched-subunit amino acid transport protein
MVGEANPMRRSYRRHRPLSERVCDVLSWISCGVLLGLGIAALLQPPESREVALGMKYQLATTAALLVTLLPRAILDVASRVRRHRRLAALMTARHAAL